MLPINGMTPARSRAPRRCPHRARIDGKPGTFALSAHGPGRRAAHAEYGHVAFAVLNSWVPVPEARQRQDALLAR